MNDLIMREEYLLEAAREVNIQLPKFKAKHFIGNSHSTIDDIKRTTIKQIAKRVKVSIEIASEIKKIA